jgi:hypothetical protein
MVSMLDAVKPKSNQLNSDDLRGRNLIITIRDIKFFLLNGEHAIKVFYAGDNNKPYIPSKGMRRVILEMWGEHVENYIGKRLELSRDATIKFGGKEVGGIVITGASHITKEETYLVRMSRESVKPLKVKKLQDADAKPTTQDAAAKAKHAADVICADIAACASVEAVQDVQSKSSAALQRFLDSYPDLAEKVAQTVHEKLNSLGYFTGDALDDVVTEE